MPSPYQPSDLQVGGARVSTSMLAVHAHCPAEFFYNYLAPHPSDLAPDDEVREPKALPSTGLGGEGREPQALSPTGTGTPTTHAGMVTPSNADANFGTDIHAALEVYRLTGWRDGADTGEYKVGVAVDKFLEDWEARRDTTLAEKWDQLRPMGVTLLQEYHSERPGGLLDWRLLANEAGEPLTEREYAIPILGGRFLYTVKTDAMAYREWPAKLALAVDYKTKGFRYVNEFINYSNLSGQGWGEVAVLHHFFPEIAMGRMQFELLVKDRGRSSSLPYVQVCEVEVTPAKAKRWLKVVESQALRIAWQVAEWNARCAKGEDPYQAGMDVFPTTGQLIESGTCARYGRTCDFAPVCEDFDERGARPVLMGMEPRSLVEEAK
jgi:hypothetical protein